MIPQSEDHRILRSSRYSNYNILKSHRINFKTSN